MGTQTDGSIPACAGEPSLHPSAHIKASVYPRVCGGTLNECVALDDRQGLSPRVRGNRILQDVKRLKQRSIPACAGEPRRTGLPSQCGRVYPRVCGGTELTSLPARLWSGLSPRVRGNQCNAHKRNARTGSIPACAGEPKWGGVRCQCCWVYPRVCGGTYLPFRSLSRMDGLSPRVRGNPGVDSACPAGVRSIPACAGEPEWLFEVVEDTRVYPRVCGGTIQTPSGSQSVTGLSPRVRGNLATPKP